MLGKTMVSIGVQVWESERVAHVKPFTKECCLCWCPFQVVKRALETRREYLL